MFRLTSLPNDQNYPRTTSTSAQSFLSCEAKLHSAPTHATDQKKTAIQLRAEIETVKRQLAAPSAIREV